MADEWRQFEGIERREAARSAASALSNRALKGAVIRYDGNPRACGDISWLLTALPTPRPHWMWLEDARPPVIVVSREADRDHLQRAGVEYETLVLAPNAWLPALQRLSSGIDPRHIGYAGASELAPALVLPDDQRDLTNDFKAARIAKSDWRIERLVSLGELIDEALDEVISLVAEYRTPRELVAAGQQALVRRGAIHTLVYVSSGPFFSSPPRDIELRDGDPLSVYLEAGDRYGHWLEAVQCLSVGAAEPRSPLAHTARACEAAVRLELGNFNAGEVAIAAAEAAAEELAESLHWSHSVLHGVGLGDQEALPDHLSAGATVAVHTSISDRHSGASSGASYLTTDDGLRRLCGGRSDHLGASS